MFYCLREITDFICVVSGVCLCLSSSVIPCNFKLCGNVVNCGHNLLKNPLILKLPFLLQIPVILGKLHSVIFTGVLYAMIRTRRFRNIQLGVAERQLSRKIFGEKKNQIFRMFRIEVQEKQGNKARHLHYVISMVRILGFVLKMPQVYISW